MTVPQFFGMITRSDEVIAELMKQKEYGEDFKPGFKTILVLNLIMDAFFLLLGWCVFAVFLALAGLLGGTGMLGSLFGMGLGLILSPFTMLLTFVEGTAMAVVFALLFAFIADFLEKKLFDNKGGKEKLVFNLIPHATLPFYLFIVIPILGWLIIGLGVLLNTYRVIKLVYQEKEPVRAIVVMLVASGFSTMVGWIVFMGLAMALAPLYFFDPFRILTGTLIDKVTGAHGSYSAALEPKREEGPREGMDARQPETGGTPNQGSMAAAVSTPAAPAPVTPSAMPSPIKPAPMVPKPVATKPKPAPKAAALKPVPAAASTAVPTQVPQGGIKKEDVDKAVDTGKKLFDMFK